MTRTKNSIKNITFSLVGQTSDIILSFVVRTIFVYYLGAEYLGVNGLFTNILSLLSLAELGIGSAITYSLYEPLANNNSKKIKGIMSVFKKAYISIAGFILLAGLLLLPFLHFFIKDMPDISNIRLIYIIFLLNSAVSYLFSYKRALIIADQKKYIDSIYHYTGRIILGIAQIAIIIITRNFILYLLLKLLEIVVVNILISRKVDKLYPLLKDDSPEEIQRSDLQTIIKNVKALFFHKMGGVVVSGTDNLLISKFVGLISVGIYSNYNLIISSINMFINILFQSITASVGNLGATGDNVRTKSTFEWIDFIGFWIISFSTVALLNLLNPFISLWIGNEYIFEMNIVILIVVKFYIMGIINSVLIFKEALGLFWYDRYKPIFESIINLVASIVLALYFGLPGILLGTIISTLLTATWIEPIVLFRYRFKTNVSSYFTNYFKRIFIVAFLCITTVNISNLFVDNSLVGFILRIIITVIVPNFLLIILFKGKKELIQTIQFIKSTVINRNR